MWCSLCEPKNMCQKKDLEKTSTEVSYKATEGNVQASENTPIFCGFLGSNQNVTPFATEDHKENLTFLMECVDPNFQPTEPVLASIESQEDEDNDSIF